MPTLDSLKWNILTECEEDYVGLWSIIRDAEDAFPEWGQATVREQVLKLLRELLVAREIQAGLPTAEGRFRALRMSPEKILARIQAEWPVARRPTIGEGLWFTKAKKPNPLVDLVETVKSDNDSGKYPVKIDPKKYGFDTEDEYWRRIRELAGVPDANKS